MKNTNFGIEIEMTGITRRKAATILANHFGIPCDGEMVRDQQGRIWKLEHDGSINTTGGSDTSVELVSPICNYADIETIQEIIRKLREAKAKVNDSCGIHIHIDARNHTAATLRNICNIVVSKEDILTKALGIRASRQERYCKKANQDFIGRINKNIPRTKEKFMSHWYGANHGATGSHHRYHQSRYHMVNIHSVQNRGTVEFRMFNSTLHAGKVKAYIQLCLAINNQAMTQAYATPNKTKSDNLKYTFRTWLLRMGMIGDEFKTARKHLLDALDGDIAFRNGRQAVAA